MSVGDLYLVFDTFEVTQIEGVVVARNVKRILNERTNYAKHCNLLAFFKRNVKRVLTERTMRNIVFSLSRFMVAEPRPQESSAH